MITFSPRGLAPLIAILLPLSLLAGCTSFLPSTPLPAPVLRHAGEVQATIANGSYGIAGSGAGAITDNVGLGGLFSTNNQNDGLHASSYSTGEGMLIFSKPFHGGSLLSLAAGVGAGKTSYSDLNTELRGLFTRFFAQALYASALGMLTNRDSASPYIEGGGLLRVSRFNFHDVYSFGWSTDISGATFLEPGFFFRGVWGIFTIGGQVGFEVPLGATENIPYATTDVALEFGVRFGGTGEEN